MIVFPASTQESFLKRDKRPSNGLTFLEYASIKGLNPLGANVDLILETTEPSAISSG
jgi:hypothetical protein